MGEGARISLLKEIHFPHSLGILYSAFTAFLGFNPNSGEYKVMGLAPFGTPTHTDAILREIVDVKADGSFRLNMDYFDFCVGRALASQRFDALFSMKPRLPESELDDDHLNLAASIQAVTDEIMLRIARSIALDTGAKNLCMAGGVALNCVANGKILRDGAFERIWIQPAAGDGGGALGAALAVWHAYLGSQRIVAPQRDGMHGAFLGPSFTEESVRSALDAFGARYRIVSEGCRLVPGSNGIRSARLGCAFHSRRSPLAQHAENTQSQDQVPRGLPSFRSCGVSGQCGRVVRP
jgi:carbamoyltransferase